MREKNLYDQMKWVCASYRSRRPKEIEGNRASPSIIKMRLKELARDPESHDAADVTLSDRFLGVARHRCATPVSFQPIVRWLAAQHLRPWEEVEAELQAKIRNVPRGLRQQYMPTLVGNNVCFWDRWILGEVDDDGIFHDRSLNRDEASVILTGAFFLCPKQSAAATLPTSCPLG